MDILKYSLCIMSFCSKSDHFLFLENTMLKSFILLVFCPSRSSLLLNSTVPFLLICPTCIYLSFITFSLVKKEVKTAVSSVTMEPCKMYNYVEFSCFSSGTYLTFVSVMKVPSNILILIVPTSMILQGPLFPIITAPLQTHSYVVNQSLLEHIWKYKASQEPISHKIWNPC